MIVCVCNDSLMLKCAVVLFKHLKRKVVQTIIKLLLY